MKRHVMQKLCKILFFIFVSFHSYADNLLYFLEFPNTAKIQKNVNIAEFEKQES